MGQNEKMGLTYLAAPSPFAFCFTGNGFWFKNRKFEEEDDRRPICPKMCSE